MEDADITAALQAIESNSVSGQMRGFHRFFTGFCPADHGKDASASGFPLTLGIKACAGVINPAAVGNIESGNAIARTRSLGVTRRSQHDTHAPAFVEGQKVAAQFALGTGMTKSGKIPFHQRHHSLAFRVTKTAIVFDHLRAARREHEAEVKKPAIRQTLAAQTLNRRAHDLALELSRTW